MSDVQATLLRVFVNEDARAGGRPVFDAIVEALRAAGISGASVLKGIEGYGSRGHLHAQRTFDLATGMPVVIEVTDARTKVEAVIPHLRATIERGLITLETVTIPAGGLRAP